MKDKEGRKPREADLTKRDEGKKDERDRLPSKYNTWPSAPLSMCALQYPLGPIRSMATSTFTNIPSEKAPDEMSEDKYRRRVS